MYCCILEKTMTVKGDEVMAEDFLIFIAIPLAIFLWVVMQAKARYNLFK